MLSGMVGAALLFLLLVGLVVAMVSVAGKDKPRATEQARDRLDAGDLAETGFTRREVP